MEGYEQDYQAVCNGELEQAKAAIHASGGEIAGMRNASLEEIFVAHVGRGALPDSEG